MSRTLNPAEYHLDALSGLSSPRLVVFEERVDRNISKLRESLEAIASGGFEHLCTHVKTHKSSWVTKRMLDSGIESFKCSLNELDILVEARVPKIFIAYPLLDADAAKVAGIVSSTGLNIWCQVGAVEHARILQRAASQAGVVLPVMVDVDVGNVRTGSTPERCLEIAREMATGDYSAVQLRGIHAYDGHNHAAEADERQRLADEAMDQVASLYTELQTITKGAIERVIVAGTPPYQEDLQSLMRRKSEIDAQIEVSPGTWIYWDTNYDRLLPGAFDFAALLYAQVMDRPGDDRVTLNLGHKRWGIDSGPIQLFSVPGLEFISASEEHTVLRATGEAVNLEIGDRVLFVPKHVCPTVNLWGHFTLVKTNGEIVEDLPVDGRNN